ncbi:MAG: aminotransferase class IV [Candidatus Azotimanducaceae bacterium WSBS_2022_MAG_OTU7]
MANWCPGAKPRSTLTHTLHYGMGVFEGVRAYPTANGPAIFRLHDHTDRLFRSAHILNIEIPWSKEELNAAQLQVVRENKLQEAYLRPMCFYGSEAMGLRADNLKTLHCCSLGMAKLHDACGQDEGIKVRTSSYTRHHVNITMCKAKANGNYINLRCWRSRSADSG